MHLSAIKKIILARKNFLLLLLIIVVASFLRFYNLEDWLRVNNDQVRDAIIVDNIISGEDVTLLGPKVGGTGFNLGPVFYYIGAFSTLIFKDSPVNLAYPIIFFFLLSVPIFFYISKELFTYRIALVLTLLYGTSAFVIKYSRFAWNPNMLPFFSLLALLSFYKLNDEKLARKEMLFWSIAAGIAVSISMQLHTTTFFILPAFCFFVFIYAFIKKRFRPLSFAIIIAIVFLSSVPQIVYEFRSGGENYAAFSKGLHKKTGSSSNSLLKNAKHGVICSVQTNIAILSGIAMSDNCDISSQKNRKSPWFWPLIFSSSLLFFGSIFLFLKRFIQEKDEQKKYLLGIILLYLALFSAILIPLEEISQRFFITVIFIPLFLFGFWLSLLSKIKNPARIILLTIIIGLLLASNANVFKKMYLDSDGKGKYFGGTKFGDTKSVTDYISRDIKNDDGRYDKYFVINFGSIKLAEYILKPINMAYNIRYYIPLDDISADTEVNKNAAIYVVTEVLSKKSIDNFPGFTIIQQKKINAKYMVSKIIPRD